MSDGRAGPVLIISHSDDAHADRVVGVLGSRSIPVARINTDSWPPTWHISISVDAQGVVCKLSVAGQSFALSEVRSIWFRRIVDPHLSTPLPSDEMRMLVTEREEALNAMFALYDGRTLGNPLRYRAVDNKVAHLVLAQRLGITIPATLLTSSRDDAEQFIDTVGAAIMKLQRSVYLERPDGLHAVYTTRVDESLRTRLAHVAAAPSLFQEEIAKLYELRITVVGEHCFACRIDSQASPLTELDYRKYDFDHVAHTPYDLPPEVVQQCVALVAATGLPFASMDFVRTASGRYVFLDLNVNGQWLWTEELGKLPISEAIAGFLAP